MEGGAVRDIFPDIAGAGEQVWTVPQGRHEQGIPGELALAHDVNRQVGEVEVFQGHGADIVIVGYSHRVGAAVRGRPAFRPIAHLHHHILRQDILAVKKGLERPLHLGQRPFPLMERGENRDQHIGVMLDVIQIEVVFIVAVGAGVGVQVVLQLRLQRTVGGLGPQHIPVLGGVGAGSHRPHRPIPHRYQGGHTRLHHHQEQNTGNQEQRPHRMPPHHPHRLFHQLLRSGGGLFGGPGPLLGGLPRLFPILPFQLFPVPQTGGGAFERFRLFLGQLAGLIIRLGLDKLGLGAGGGPGRAGSDALLGKAHHLPAHHLAHQLGAVSALGSHILMLHLVELAMHKAVYPMPGGPAHPPEGAALLGGLLVRQTVPGRFQLVPPLFHLELGLGGTLLLAFHAELGLFLLLATLARSGPVTRPFVHWPCPPAWW